MTSFRLVIPIGSGFGTGTTHAIPKRIGLQSSPWRQRQRNKRTARNFAVASSALLNRESLEEVLPEAGVLVGAPLLSYVTTGKAKKEGGIQETHRKG